MNVPTSRRQAAALTASSPAPVTSFGRPAVGRLVLVLGTGLTLALIALATRTPPADIDPDLVTLMRGMALIKGAFALVAAAVCYWRLARPMPAWREVTYIGGTWMMAGGGLAIFQLQYLGTAGAALHVAMFGLIALALTDKSFFAALPRTLRTR